MRATTGRKGLALRRIVDGGEFVAIAKLHGTFESHAPNSPVGHETVKCEP